jgi:hypothetical protein
MNRKANETFEMVTRTGDFAITSVGLFPKTSAATEIAAALEAGVKTLKEEARNIASAEMALRSGGSVRGTARENLNIYLQRIKPQCLEFPWGRVLQQWNAGPNIAKRIAAHLRSFWDPRMRREQFSIGL